MVTNKVKPDTGSKLPFHQVPCGVQTAT